MRRTLVRRSQSRLVCPRTLSIGMRELRRFFHDRPHLDLEKVLGYTTETIHSKAAKEHLLKGTNPEYGRSGRTSIQHTMRNLLSQAHGLVMLDVLDRFRVMLAVDLEEVFLDPDKREMAEIILRIGYPSRSTALAREFYFEGNDEVAGVDVISRIAAIIDTIEECENPYRELLISHAELKVEGEFGDGSTMEPAQRKAKQRRIAKIVRDLNDGPTRGIITFLNRETRKCDKMGSDSLPIDATNKLSPLQGLRNRLDIRRRRKRFDPLTEEFIVQRHSLIGRGLTDKEILDKIGAGFEVTKYRLTTLILNGVERNPNRKSS